LFKKIVGGDRGDNIPNIYKGLGEKTTNKVFDLYFEYFGKPDFSKDCFNKICDIIIDLKKLDSEKFDEIKSRIDLNNKLINLYKVPNKINERILTSFNERI
jgi:ribosome biogenesis SPOUT family RNA methylase Rps3